MKKLQISTMLLALLAVIAIAGPATQANAEEAKVSGTISGAIQLFTISDYNGGDVLHITRPCYGCFVNVPGFMTISDEKGQFQLTGLPEGEYSVNVSYETCVTALHDNYDSPRFSITKAAPNYAFSDPLPMYEARGTLAGVARLDGQTDHSNIVVTVEGLTGYSTTTDAKGNYKMPALPVRNEGFVVTFKKAGYELASLVEVTVPKDLVNVLADVKLAPKK